MKNLKKLNSYLAYLIVGAVLLLVSACNNDDDNLKTSGFKTVVYEVDVSAAADKPVFVVKGEYVNEKGEKITVSENAPWRLSFKNVPQSVKVQFNGYLYNVGTSEVIGVISMVTTDAKSGKTIYENKKVMNHTQNSVYTAEQLKTISTFAFAD